MKVGILSDTHGSFALTRKALSFLGKEVGLTVHLGDVLYHGPRNPLPPFYDPRKLSELFKNFEGRIVFIRGNCDSEVDEVVLGKKFVSVLSMVVGDRLALFAHTKEELEKIGGDVLFFGHTHVPVFEKTDGKILVNPGSVAIPKGGSSPSFAVLDMDSLTVIFYSVENLSPVGVFQL